MDMYDCKNKGYVKEVSSDTHKLTAFVRIAEKKQKSVQFLPDEFHESKVTLLYDSLRILLEALALKRGFKIYNHVCYTAFLKEVMQEPSIAQQFDTFRKVRNAINYYAKELEGEESQEILARMQTCVQRVRQLLQ